MTRVLLMLGLCLLASQAQAVSIPTIAGITTIAVNASTMAKLIRHPKREGKKTAKAIKDAVRGKN